MTNLTEKWKKGELPDGEEYWVILTDEWYLRTPVKPVRAFYSCECEFEGYLDDDIKEVLAPVPSYEKWEKFRNRFSDYQIENSNLLIENTKLKGLLRECKERLIYCTISTHDVQAKINQVLGEE